MRHGGFRGFGRAEARDLVAWLTPVTQANRKPGQLAILLVEELRHRRILLPTPRVLELVIHHARIRAERALHRAMIDGIDPIQLAVLDALLTVPAGGGGLSRIARLRQAPNSPAARNLAGLIERVRAVRAIGLDLDREAAVPPAAFDALASEGLRMTTQHLRDLAQPRRAATVAATIENVHGVVVLRHGRIVFERYMLRRLEFCETGPESRARSVEVQRLWG